MKKARKNPHAGHRARFKERFLKSEGDGFRDHELLELILFYSIPRGDTNEIAHALLERFGTVGRIAEASIDELKLVDGIGDNSAILLRNIFLLTKLYTGEKKRIAKKIDTVQKAIEIAHAETMGATKELAFCMLLDKTLHLIDVKLVAVGTYDEVEPVVRRVMEHSILKGASAVIFFHNHPSGDVEPSDDDIAFTNLLSRELSMIGIELVEHLIVANSDYHAMLKNLKDEYFCFNIYEKIATIV